MGRTREMMNDARTAGSNHPYMVIGLGMTLIAMLTVGAMLVFARRKGLSARELADFRRWRSRFMANGEAPHVDDPRADVIDDDDAVA